MKKRFARTTSLIHLRAEALRTVALDDLSSEILGAAEEIADQCDGIGIERSTLEEILRVAIAIDRRLRAAHSQ